MLRYLRTGVALIGALLTILASAGYLVFGCTIMLDATAAAFIGGGVLGIGLAIAGLVRGGITALVASLAHVLVGGGLLVPLIIEAVAAPPPGPHAGLGDVLVYLVMIAPGTQLAGGLLGLVSWRRAGGRITAWPARAR